MVEDPRDRLRVERLVGHDDIDAVDELWEKRLRTAPSPIVSRRPAICAGVRWSLEVNPMSGATSLDISRAPRLLVRKISVRSKFTTVLSPRLRVPLSRSRASERQRRRRFLHFIEEDEATDHILTRRRRSIALA